MSKELEVLTKVTLYGVEIDGEKLPITYKEYVEAYNIIFQALKRNEPMKVDLKTKYALPYSGTYYECPNCKKIYIPKQNLLPRLWTKVRLER